MKGKKSLREIGEEIYEETVDSHNWIEDERNCLFFLEPYSAFLVGFFFRISVKTYSDCEELF